MPERARAAWRLWRYGDQCLIGARSGHNGALATLRCQGTVTLIVRDTYDRPADFVRSNSGSCSTNRFDLQKSAVPRVSAREIHHSQAVGAYLQHMARPKIHPDDRVTTAIRIPKDLHEQLRQAAEERQLSVNYLVVKALEDFVERLVPISELQ